MQSVDNVIAHDLEFVLDEFVPDKDIESLDTCFSHHKDQKIQQDHFYYLQNKKKN